MKKHWLGSILLGVSVALLLAVGGLVGLLILPSITYAQEGEPFLDAGDAPSSYNSFKARTATGSLLMTAYPWLSPGSARFPVVSQFGGAPATPDGYGICNSVPVCSHLGAGKSWEYEADLLDDDDGVTNIDPLLDIADRDGLDDGVEFPSQMPECRTSYVSVSGEVLTAPSSSGLPVARGFINAWFDWNRDGDWNDGSVCGCGDSEWAVRDLEVAPGPFEVEIPVVACHPGSDTDPAWVRFTLSEESLVDLWNDGDNPEWAAGGMPESFIPCLSEGETEDYYVEFEPDFEPKFVPEWGSIALLGSGLAGLAGYATLRWRTRE